MCRGDMIEDDANQMLCDNMHVKFITTTLGDCTNGQRVCFL